MYRRVVLIVLDGVGVGALPDAVAYGDEAAATLPHIAQAVGGLSLPHLAKMGLGHVVSIAGVKPEVLSQGYWGKMAEQSSGKDSVTGHWELSGVVLDQPFATFPEGFPEELIAEFTSVTGLTPLGNVAESGTDILRRLGEEHLRTGRPIIYTSSDSVFQIAAHEQIIPPEKLYAICRQVEEILLPYNVCRVIARPFVGSCRDDFRRTGGRRDFPRRPTRPTLLERMQSAGIVTGGVGKIKDLFAGQGLSRVWSTGSNTEGMRCTLEALEEIITGLVMTNLVDFDMLYGHRLDVSGFAAALEAFDAWLPQLFRCLTENDLLLITADHGCDPTTPGTDHTREYVPLLAWSPRIAGAGSLGIRQTYADVAATIADIFSIDGVFGESFLVDLT
ncbi:MAG: phosphopentomutase [Desulfuromonadales bacterium C00003093]|nr:MAG: phosphopentomutase [Desulfuromonadales bacterium C00003093]